MPKSSWPVFSLTVLPISISWSQVRFCRSACVEAGFREVVGAVEEAGDAGVEGQRVGLAVDGGGRDLVVRELRHIDRVAERLERAREGQQVLLAPGHPGSARCREGPRWCPRAAGSAASGGCCPGVAVIDDDVHVGMGGVVARRGLPHGGAVEIGVPAPDGDVDRQSGAEPQLQSRTAKRKRGKAQRCMRS